MRPANESRVVLISTAIAVVVLLFFALSLGAVLLVSRTADPESAVTTLPGSVTTLAPSTSAASIGEPDSTPDQPTPAGPATTSTNSDATSEPNTPVSTLTTQPSPPTATAAPSPTVPAATRAPTRPPQVPTQAPTVPTTAESIVTVPSAFVYANPSSDSPIIGGVERDDRVVILGSSGTWYLIRVSNPDTPRSRIEGGEGWILQDVVSPPSQPVPVITP